jgi:predicted amidohydrolase YtcJ
LQPWLDQYEYHIDESLADKVLLPGLIDPHVHPLLPALLTQMPFLAPDDWHLPTGDFPGARSPEEYLSGLEAFVAAHDFSAGPFFTWGYQPMFHGRLYREELDAHFPGKPVFLWHRSFHEIITNSAGLEFLGEIDMSQVPESAQRQVDLARGHFFEGGLSAIFPKIQGLFFEGIMAGFARFGQMVHQGGVTTVADMGTGLMAPMPMEAALIRQALGGDEQPFRIRLTPIETSYVTAGQSPEQALAEVREVQAENTDRVMLHDHFKLMADGAFYGQLFQMCEPGFVDGHEGEWVLPTEVTESFAKTFWEAGFQLHIHCNGDRGAQYSLGLLRRLLDEKPRFDHRFTLEHWGYSTEEQNREVAALGAAVSGQPWYLHVLGDMFAEHGMGADRAHQMCRFGSLADKGVPLALHSDCTMAPLEPLRLAWAAAARQTLAGNVLTPSERLSREQALRAITIDAAWILGMENDIGSIRTGKKADFSVFDDDPTEVDLDDLAHLRPWGTVFEGRVAPIERES